MKPFKTILNMTTYHLNPRQRNLSQTFVLLSLTLLGPVIGPQLASAETVLEL